MDGTTELLSISAFARRVGLAPSALRFYDDCCVLRPAWVDGATGYRFYSPAQEARAALLRSLREAGLPLAEVTVVLDGPGREGREVLERHVERMRDQAQAARAAIAVALRSLSTAGYLVRQLTGARVLCERVMAPQGRQSHAKVTDSPMNRFMPPEPPIHG